MEEISYTTPAIVFPAVSLLLLAYANKFSNVARVARTIHSQKKLDESTVRQVKNLRIRLILIRYMELFGVLGLISSLLSIFFLYLKSSLEGKILFLSALLNVFLSLMFAFIETLLSTRALRIYLKNEIKRK